MIRRIKEENYIYCNNCYSIIKHADSMRKHLAKSCNEIDNEAKNVLVFLGLVSELGD